MEAPDNHIEELIGKYLAGEGRPEDRNAVEKWIVEKEENRKYFEQIRLVFDTAAKVKEFPSFDTDEAWERMKASLDKRTKSDATGSGRSLLWSWPLKLAAGLTIATLVGIFAYNFMRSGSTEQYLVVATDAVHSDTLPNGSEVVLNRYSQISYAYNDNEQTHVVSLTGEAYFTMPETSSGRFLVEVADVFIEDIGTSFNVKAYPEAQSIEVTVDEGEVRFFTNENNGIHLVAGQAGSYNKVTGTFSGTEARPNTTAYKSRSFVFQGKTLKEIAGDLNAVYDTTLVVDSHLASCRLTVSFHQERIGEIAEVMAETLGLTVETSADSIILKGVGCE